MADDRDERMRALRGQVNAPSNEERYGFSRPASQPAHQPLPPRYQFPPPAPPPRQDSRVFEIGGQRLPVGQPIQTPQARDPKLNAVEAHYTKETLTETILSIGLRVLEAAIAGAADNVGRELHYIFSRRVFDPRQFYIPDADPKRRKDE